MFGKENEIPVWLAGLTLETILMLALTPVVSRGLRWVRVVSLALSIVMVGNALDHLAASLYLRRLAPVLPLGAVALLVTSSRAKVQGVHRVVSLINIKER